jgi:hypothetical protein
MDIPPEIATRLIAVLDGVVVLYRLSDGKRRVSGPTDAVVEL